MPTVVIINLSSVFAQIAQISLTMSTNWLKLLTKLKLKKRQWMLLTRTHRRRSGLLARITLIVLKHFHQIILHHKWYVDHEWCVNESNFIHAYIWIRVCACHFRCSLYDYIYTSDGWYGQRPPYRRWSMRHPDCGRQTPKDKRRAREVCKNSFELSTSYRHASCISLTNCNSNISRTCVRKCIY